MNRRNGTIAVVAVVALVLGFAVNAMGSDGSSSTAKPVRTITVTSTATVKASPDEAVITFGVRNEDPDSTAALASTAKDMNAVIDALKAAKIDPADIQTLNVSLDQQVQDRGKPSEHTVFVASNSVQVTIHNLSSVGSIIDSAVQAGADSVNDIQFQLSDPNTIRTDALTQAVQGARTKANALAKAAGSQVLRVVTIDEQGFRPPVYRLPYASSALVAGNMAMAAPTPVVPPDSLQVSVTVSVVWEID